MEGEPRYVFIGEFVEDPDGDWEPPVAVAAETSPAPVDTLSAESYIALVAVARAAAVSQPYRSVPHLPGQCTTCLRFLDPARMSVMAVGADPLCALCLAVSVVQECVPTTEIAARDEVEVISMLGCVTSFLRRPRQMS